MARLPRLCLPGVPLHIIQRGNNRNLCFALEEDFSAYAYWLHEYAEKYRVAIHAWVLMTNHVHLLATSETPTGISSMMQSLGRRYVQYFNYSYKRTGTLWEGRFKSCLVNAEQYLLICQRYIELNPVRANMVESPADYTWSSFKSNGLGKSIKLCTPHSVYQRLGRTSAERAVAYRALFRDHLDDALLSNIRQTTNRGMVLGNSKFRKEVEKLTGRRVHHLKRGPKPRNNHTDENEFLL